MILVNIPRVVVSRDGTVGGDDIAVGILILAVLLTLLTVTVVAVLMGFDHHIHPVKTVTQTKVVRENGLTSAQNEFIKECEKNTDDDNNPGIPNVIANPWSCTYAH
jgi:hypothetical protein